MQKYSTSTGSFQEQNPFISGIKKEAPNGARISKHAKAELNVSPKMLR